MPSATVCRNWSRIGNVTPIVRSPRPPTRPRPRRRGRDAEPPDADAPDWAPSRRLDRLRRPGRRPAPGPPSGQTRLSRHVRLLLLRRCCTAITAVDHGRGGVGCLSPRKRLRPRNRLLTLADTAMLASTLCLDSGAAEVRRPTLARRHLVEADRPALAPAARRGDREAQRLERVVRSRARASDRRRGPRRTPRARAGRRRSNRSGKFS